MLLLSLQHKVDTSAVGFVNSEELIVLRVAPLALGWERMSLAHRAVKRAADRKHCIADFFSAQPSPIEAPQQIVISINLRIVLIISAGELIGVREHDHPVHRLYRPFAVDKLRCQVIEQARIDRSLAARAEVVRGWDYTLSKMVLPNSIDQHPSGKGIGRIDYPLG